MVGEHQVRPYILIPFGGELVSAILRQTPLLHLVRTGRDAHPQVIELADTVSEIREIKHAYRQGIEPQAGIDY